MEHTPQQRPQQRSRLAGHGEGARAGSIRQHNLSTLATAAVTSPEPLSRTDLAVTTGLNRSTVTRLVDHLLSHGVVVERGTRIFGNGRPSVPLHPAPHTHVAIGAEISADYVEACVMDLTGEVLVEHYHEFAGQPPQSHEVLHTLARALGVLATQATDAGMHPVGSACGIPGLIESATGFLHTAPNLGWHNLDLQAVFPAVLPGLGTTSFQNSATLAAFAEYMACRKADDPLEDFLYVTGNSGIGSALVRRGRIEAGTRGFAGELGHVVVTDSSVVCSCGATGCLETVAAKSAIMTAAGFEPTEPIGRLLAALRRGERPARAALVEAGRQLGRALSTHLNISDTPAVVLGGLLDRLADELTPPIRAELESRVLTHAWAPVVLRRACGGQHAVSKGAGWQLLTAFLSDPDRWQHLDPEVLPYYSVEETPEVTIES